MSIQALQEKLERYEAYLAQDQNNPNLLLTIGLLKAEILQHQHQITDAITLLEQLNLEYSSSPEITGLLSLLHFDNHDARKAESYSQKALTLDSSNYNAQLVQVLLSALENKASLEKINKLLEINSQDYRLWFVLGAAQMREMNFPAAEHAFIETNTICPSFYDSWICASWCHLLQNNLDKAENSYQQAVAIDSESADGWAGLALVCALRNNITEAKHLLEKSDLLDPECFLAFITRIIITNPTSPTEASNQFNAAFPDVAPNISQILNQAILMITTDKETKH